MFFSTIKKVVKIDSAKRSLNVFRQLENYFFPQDLHWMMVFVSFLSRYPSDADNHIYSNSETRIWNPTLLVLIWCTASFQICLWISSCAHQCFAHYHAKARQKILNLNGLSLVLSLKPCLFYRLLRRFWRISQKRSRIIVFWILSLPIRLSTLKCSAIVDNLLIAITKLIPRNVFSFSKLWNFFHSDEHKGFIVQPSILAALLRRSPKKVFLLGKLFHLDWVVFLAWGETLLAW